MQPSTIVYMITGFLVLLIFFVVSVVAWHLFSRDYRKLGE
jgi:hypothetical protein